MLVQNHKRKKGWEEEVVLRASEIKNKRHQMMNDKQDRDARLY